MVSALVCVSATSTVTSRSARARISWLSASLARGLGRLALTLGLHALVDRLAVLPRQVRARMRTSTMTMRRPRPRGELVAHPRHRAARSSRTTWVSVASPSHAAQRGVSSVESRESRLDRADRLIELHAHR